MLTVYGVEVLGRLHQAVDDGAQGIVRFYAVVEGRRVETWVWGAAEEIAVVAVVLMSVTRSQ